MLFGKADPGSLDSRTLADATAELPGAALGVGQSVVAALVATGLAESRGAARRLVAEGGVSLNNRKVEDPEQSLTEDDYLHGVVALLKRGRKHLAAVRRSTQTEPLTGAIGR